MNSPDDLAIRHIAEHYDSTPYASNAFFYSSPGHLRAVAHLYGMDTVPLEQARVLELGCSAGGNLLPFALAYPRAAAAGVDLSPVQIARGQEVARDLKAGNLTLRAMSLTDITPAFGQFDYIIAHGVYSWVPPDVQQAILRVCRENLSPRGLAYISYNAYPGWKIGDILRDAMLLHGEGARDDGERVARGKAMLDALEQGMIDNGLTSALREAIAQVRKHSDYYLAHEHLETFNLPCYFAFFARAAAQAGLAYLGDAEPHTELPVTYGAAVQQGNGVVALREAKVQRQQYLDFAVARNFRKSLLVRGGGAGGMLDLPDQNRLRDLRVAARFSGAARDEKARAGQKAYQNQRGRKLHTNDPAVEAVMGALTRAWPASLSWGDLCERTRGGIAAQPAQAEGAISATAPGAGEADAHADAVFKALAALFRLGMLYLAREAGPYDDNYDRKAEEGHPRLVPGFAYLAPRNAGARFGVGCFNLWHDTAHGTLSPADLRVLPQLDGRLGVADVLQLMGDAAVKAADEEAGKEGAAKPQADLRAEAQQHLNDLLDRLHAQGVLLSSPRPG